MFLFRKAERRYMEMRFILDDFSTHEFDNERCLIDIEAYGEIDGKMKYCYSSFALKNPQMYENGDFESMLSLLRASNHKTVLVLAALALVVTTMTANSTCVFCMHQPKMPNGSEKLRKF